MLDGLGLVIFAGQVELDQLSLVLLEVLFFQNLTERPIQVCLLLAQVQYLILRGLNEQSNQPEHNLFLYAHQMLARFNVRLINLTLLSVLQLQGYA